MASAVLALDLPRRSQAMARAGQAVARGALLAGDLVFFDLRGQRDSHVGIYLGDGRFVHAPARSGRVRIESMQARYWAARFAGARRLIATAPASDPAPVAEAGAGPTPPAGPHLEPASATPIAAPFGGA